MYCPMNLNVPFGKLNPPYYIRYKMSHIYDKAGDSGKETVCNYCHAIRLTLYEVPPEKLVVPLIVYSDFEKVPNH